MKLTSLLWRLLYLEHGQSVEYFAHQFSFTPHQMLNHIARYNNNEHIQQASIKH